MVERVGGSVDVGCGLGCVVLWLFWVQFEGVVWWSFRAVMVVDEG